MNKQLQRKYEDSAFYTLLGFIGLSLMLCSVCAIYKECIYKDRIGNEYLNLDFTHFDLINNNIEYEIY